MLGRKGSGSTQIYVNFIEESSSQKDKNTLVIIEFDRNSIHGRHQSQNTIPRFCLDSWSQLIEYEI